MASEKSAWKLKKIYTNGWLADLTLSTFTFRWFFTTCAYCKWRCAGRRAFLRFTPLNSVQLRFALFHLARICWNHSLEKVLAAAHTKFVLFSIFTPFPLAHTLHSLFLLLFRFLLRFLSTSVQVLFRNFIKNLPCLH